MHLELKSNWQKQLHKMFGITSLKTTTILVYIGLHLNSIIIIWKIYLIGIFNQCHFSVIIILEKFFFVVNFIKLIIEIITTLLFIKICNILSKNALITANYFLSINYSSNYKVKNLQKRKQKRVRKG